MQHMWYEVRCGDAHLAMDQLPKALKKFTAVSKHFSDFAEDQFDFHSYCIRKLTLRSYVGLLRMEDRLHHHPFYIRVSQRASAGKSAGKSRFHKSDTLQERVRE
jgi:peptide alpha-N-acetyltransferase